MRDFNDSSNFRPLTYKKVYSPTHNLLLLRHRQLLVQTVLTVQSKAYKFIWQFVWLFVIRKRRAMSHFQDSFWVSLRSCEDIQYRAHECISAKVNLGLPSSPPRPPKLCTEGRNKNNCSFITTHVCWSAMLKIYSCKVFGLIKVC